MFFQPRMNTDEYGLLAQLGVCVAQTGSLLYRRLAVGEAWRLRRAYKFPAAFCESHLADFQSAAQQTATLRHARKL